MLPELAPVTEDEQLPQHVFKTVERMLYDYRLHQAIVANYELARNDILERARQWEPGMSTDPTGTPADPTASKAAELEKLEARTERSRRILAMIDSVVETLSEEKRQLVELKYFAKDRLTNEQVAAELHISRGRFYQVRREIIRDIAFVMGLL